MVDTSVNIRGLKRAAADLAGKVAPPACGPSTGKKIAIIGGGLWAVWGVITLAGGLKDQNGPATQSGVWQVVGGGLIIAAAALFSNIAL